MTETAPPDTVVTSIARTLDQELLALARGASLECPCCGEFVMRLRGVLACPECRSILADGREIPEVALPTADTAS
jgi:Zn finger protein HypA/HybF involved in hydrogenase expression